jgi:hypothetical protein
MWSYGEAQVCLSAWGRFFGVFSICFDLFSINFRENEKSFFEESIAFQVLRGIS